MIQKNLCLDIEIRKGPNGNKVGWPIENPPDTRQFNSVKLPLDLKLNQSILAISVMVDMLRNWCFIHKMRFKCKLTRTDVLLNGQLVQLMAKGQIKTKISSKPQFFLWIIIITIIREACVPGFE